MRVLVVEDEKLSDSLISETVKKAGYSVDSCRSGFEALEFLSCAGYDVVILDTAISKMNGLELLKLMRGRRDRTPVVLISASAAPADMAAGLDSGADYYLVRPIDPRVLSAVVRSVTRKYTDTRSAVLSADDLTLDSVSRSVTRGGNPIQLTAKEFTLLEYMMRNKNVVLTREMIENNVWNYDYSGGTNVVDVYVGYLRKKVDSGYEKQLIHTVWGTGWVLRGA